jgi:hypothetical protein
VSSAIARSKIAEQSRPIIMAQKIANIKTLSLNVLC